MRRINGRTGVRKIPCASNGSTRRGRGRRGIRECGTRVECVGSRRGWVVGAETVHAGLGQLDLVTHWQMLHIHPRVGSGNLVPGSSLAVDTLRETPQIVRGTDSIHVVTGFCSHLPGRPRRPCGVGFRELHRPVLGSPQFVADAPTRPRSSRDAFLHRHVVSRLLIDADHRDSGGLVCGAAAACRRCEDGQTCHQKSRSQPLDQGEPGQGDMHATVSRQGDCLDDDTQGEDEPRRPPSDGHQPQDDGAVVRTHEC